VANSRMGVSFAGVTGKVTGNVTGERARTVDSPTAQRASVMGIARFRDRDSPVPVRLRGEKSDCQVRLNC
jgi:hypothetical protein